MRVKLIDIAKGISIILVAFSHSHLMHEIPRVNNALALFRMPLFFFLSGVFFKEIVPFRKAVISKTDTLLKPYFFTLLAVIISMAAVSGFKEPWSAITGIFYGNGHTIPYRAFVPLWFLTHLWFLYLFTHVLFGVTKIQLRHAVWQGVFVIFSIIAGALTIRLFWSKGATLPGLPFSIDVAMISLAFFSAGRFLREQIKAFVPNPFILLIALSGWLLISFGTNTSVDLNQRVYTNPIFSTTGACLGIYLILSISYYVQTISPATRFLRYAGESSLFILIFHCLSESKIYSLLVPVQAPGLMISVVAFLACIGIPLIIREIVKCNNYLSLAYLPIKRNNELFVRLGLFKPAEPTPSIDYFPEKNTLIHNLASPSAVAKTEHIPS